MRKFLISIFVFICSFFLSVHAENFLEEDLLYQMYTLDDASILAMREGKYYLNIEKIRVSDNRMLLDSDIFGPLTISCLRQNLHGVYVGLYDYYTCDHCGRAYQYAPSECGSCGGTSFTRHEQSPGNES